MLATQIEVSDGTLNIINVGIEFFEQADISVSLDQMDALILGVDYNWTAATTIQFLPTAGVPGGLVPAGVEVLIRRDTKNDSMYNTYDGGAPFSRLTLDENFEQLLRLSQEFSEGLGLDGLRADLDMNGYRVLNLGDPVNLTDAANKEYVDVAINELVASGQGPQQSAVNVLYVGPDALVHNLQEFSSVTDASLGGALTGYKRRVLDRKISTVSDSLSGQPTSVWEYADLCTGYTPGGDPNTWDWRPAVQAAVDAWKDVYFPRMAVPYRVGGEILLNTDNCITMSAGVRIQQLTVNTTTFKVISKDNVWVHCNGALILGEGAWSNSWTGMGGHDDRAFQLWGCTNSGIVLPRIRNCASAGIAIFGGSNILIDSPTIEGTHLFGSPIPLLGNFQAGVYIRDEATYGICDNLRIPNADISGVAQGVLSELYSAASVISRAHSIPNANIHDIPGQHGFYIQGGAVNCDGAVLTNIGLAGVKIQSADANAAIRSFSAQGVTASGIGSNLFEMNNTGTGSVNGVLLSGTVDGCAVGLAVNGTIRDLRCDIVCTNVTSNAVLVQGSGAKDLDIKVTAQTVGDAGVVVTATNASGIRITPVIRECNQTGPAGTAGVLLQSASADVVLIDPECTDTSGKMTYGIFHSTLGGTMKIRGSVTVSGATDTGVRATGKILEYPAEQNVQGVNGAYIGLANITSANPIRVSGQSGTASNIVLWQYTLPNESAIKVNVQLVGKLLGSAERRAVELTACVYRDGSVATVQGAPVTIADVASAGFTGVVALTVNGADDVILVANSGGVATYDWFATVTTIQVL